MEHGLNMKNKGENSLPNAPITDACNYAFNYVNYPSLKAPVCQWVSECVWMFPNSSETANPSELKFWGMIPLGIGKVLG